MWAVMCPDGQLESVQIRHSRWNAVGQSNVQNCSFMVSGPAVDSFGSFMWSISQRLDGVAVSGWRMKMMQKKKIRSR